MADPRGFLKQGRELPTRRPVDVRITDWREVYEDFATDSLREQASRCMDCGIPFCHHGCPLGNLIPEWNDLVRRDDFAVAAERLHATNNFPEFTGRLCPAPCEAACVLGISDDPVTIKQVEVSIIDRAYEEGFVTPQLPEQRSGKTVAVVGSGPAGLAAAQQLTRAGHTVTVYERADRIGGLLRYGIPEFKMEKRHLDLRLQQMRAEGTEFVTSCDVGRDLSAAQLCEQHDAVLLAGGATLSRELPAPGRELAGIHVAMDYLPPSNHVQQGDIPCSPITSEGKRVVIIGGGDTGADCLGTAHRQGALSVHQLEILPRPPEERPAANPWPTWPLIMRSGSAHEEGGERVYAVNTERFLDDGNGAVRGIALHAVELVDGTFTRVDGTDRELPAELVLLALGFTGADPGELLGPLGVEVDQRGRVVRDAGWRTTAENVFVCGDMGRGQSLIVWAIAEGRSAAAALDEHLMGRTQLPAPIAPTSLALA